MKAKYLITLIILINLTLGVPFGMAQAQTDIEALAKTLREQIDNLQSQIIKLQEQLSQATEKLVELEQAIEFDKDLRSGTESEDVKNLQQFLSQYPDIYPEGMVTGFFGPLTENAIRKFQEKYSDDVLKPYGLSKGTGFVGPSTRAKLNELAKGAATPAIPATPAAVPATPAVPTEEPATPAVPAVPAIPAQPATTTPTAATTTPDITAPANVTNLTAKVDIGSAALSWTNPIDSDFAGTKIIKKWWSSSSNIDDGTQIYNGTGNSATDYGLLEGITYYYKFFTYDEVPNYSSGVSTSVTPTSTAVIVTEPTPTPTLTPTPTPTPIPTPTIPTTTTTTTTTNTTATTTTSTTATTTTSVATTTTTVLADTAPPSVPTNLIATPVSTSQINLSWASSTDNVGVAGYRIYQGLVNSYQIGISNITSYSVTGLSPSITYTYTVSAYDAAGNESVKSASVSTKPVRPTITITSPNGGEQWVIGNTYRVSWTSDAESGRMFIHGDAAGSHFSVCDVVYTGQKYCDWAIPSTLAAGTQYKIEIHDADWGGSDWSNNYFSITAPVSSGQTTTTPTIKTGSGTAPDGSPYYFTIGTGRIEYSSANAAEGVGYLYSDGALLTTPDLYFAGIISPSPCGALPSGNYGYQGLSSICQFTSAANYTFSNQPYSLKFGDRNSACYQGILPFRQGGLYGGLELVDINSSGTLYYNYWYDESGGSDFSSICASVSLPKTNLDQLAGAIKDMQSQLVAISAAVLNLLKR